MEYIDTTKVTRNALMKNYQDLLNAYQEMNVLCKKDTEYINALDTELNIAKSTEEHILKEIKAGVEKDKNKVKNEINDICKRYNEMELSYEKLQNEYRILMTENKELSKQLNDQQHNLSGGILSINEENKLNDSQIALNESERNCVHELERRNEGLLHQLKDYDECSKQNAIILTDLKRRNDAFKNQIEDLEANLKNNRNELNEKVRLLENTQEQLTNANIKYTSLVSFKENHDPDNKSLFTEVSTQRQGIKQRFEVQKESYVELKKALHQNENEIRCLQRENTAILNEIKTCANAFSNANTSIEESLQSNIRQLLDQNACLEEKLKWLQNQLRDASIDNSKLCPGLILDMCKRETEFLKQELHTMGIQNATLEEQLRNVSEEINRWRSKSLTYRYILRDRKNLMKFHKNNG